jgi:hypothetical protein
LDSLSGSSGAETKIIVESFDEAIDEVTLGKRSGEDADGSDGVFGCESDCWFRVRYEPLMSCMADAAEAGMGQGIRPRL